MMLESETILVIILSYLVGSIPFGLLWARVFGLGDLRKIGSGNIGATNALRTGNKRFALLTLVSDMLKGAGAVIVSAYLFPDLYHTPIFAGYAALMGHIFPLWLKFKGGKGVATSIGVLLALSWPVGVVCILTWIVIAFLSRMSSLSALLASVHAPIYAIAFGYDALAITLVPMVLIVWCTHRGNIKRLLKGQEPRVGEAR